MRKYTVTLVLIFSLFGTHARNCYTINEAWQFTRADQPHYLKIVSLPHTWNAIDAVDETPGYYRGKGTYVREIFIGEEGRGKRIFIQFDGANQTTRLRINGQEAGSHKGGYTRFCFDITPFVQIGATNLFEIIVDNSHDANIPPLSADFTFFGGIYRDIQLVFTNPVHISLGDCASSGVYVTTPRVSRHEAEVSTRILVSNQSKTACRLKITRTILSPQQEIVARGTSIITLNPGQEEPVNTKPLKISNPSLWSPDSPALYTLHTELVDARNGHVVDASDEIFGLRWFRFDPTEGFFLNGQRLKLIGTNRHQCRLGIGNALSDEQHIEDIRLLKEMGGNFLRISHYPQDPLVLEMCDKLGIITTVEIPIVNAISENEAFFENSLDMACEMVKQNFNHPSLVAWAYMNEVLLRPPYPATSPEYKTYCHEVSRQARALETLIRELDSSRYTMMAFHGSLDQYRDAGLIDIPQICGWNLYQGWYGGRFDGLDSFLDGFHSQFPDKPILITEYGADADPRLHSFTPQRFDFTDEYAALYHEYYLKAIFDRPFVAGANIWNLNDFHSEQRGDAVPHINCKGVTGLDRKKKSSYLFYQARLLSRPFVAIADNWQHRAGSGDSVCRQPVTVYSNLDSIRVVHNGQKIGEFPVKKGFACIEIPFVRGENLLSVSAENGPTAIADYYKCNFDLIPASKFNPSFTQLNVMLGSKRYFEEQTSDICWIPEQPYEDNAWGYVGGEALQPRTPFGILPAYSGEIRNTDLDPLFQTQRTGLESFRADVPDGLYAIAFYWAHLASDEKKAPLPYLLGNDAVIERDQTDNSFNVDINGSALFRNLDIQREAGAERAVIKKTRVTVAGNRGLTITFKPTVPGGKTYLNAIRIVKLD